MSRSITCWSITAPCSSCSTRSASTSLLTENMFGDILSDEGAVLAGSIGMLPSASIGAKKASGAWTGLYEPVHGSAPDIAGQNKANPFGAIGSVAAMLEYSFGLTEEAAAVNRAMEQVLNSGKSNGGPASLRHARHHRKTGEAVCQAHLNTSARRFGIRTSFTKNRARPALIYIDLHLVHEVTSPQAFPGSARSRA